MVSVIIVELVIIFSMFMMLIVSIFDVLLKNISYFSVYDIGVMKFSVFMWLLLVVINVFCSVFGFFCM